MDRIDAINWIEQWADRHSVQLKPYRRPRPGEHRVGWARMPAEGELISNEALAEILAMGGQLTFEEFGPPPASGESGPAAPAAGGLPGGGDQPPMNNMGGKVTEEVFRGFNVEGGLFAAVDQFTVVGLGDEQRDAMKATLQRFLGEGQPGLFGMNTYKETWQFECGAMLEWSVGRQDWCFRARGRTLQLVGQERHVEFLLACAAHADHCTRVDSRLDDYSRQLIDLAEVREARAAGNFLGPRKSQVIEDGRIARGELKVEGASYVFGTRDGARVIFYDKGLESKGRICSNRLEVGHYKEKADAAWSKLIEGARRGVEHFVRAVGEVVCGSIDFRERRDHRHVARMHQLPWWSRIVEKLGSVKLRVEKATSTLNAALCSMIKQYGKKLGRAAVVAEGMGHDLVLQLVHAVENLRDGQELADRDLSPLEAAFQPAGAFRLARVGTS